MNASEKNSFEEQWRDAFENAESTPDPAIWSTIETHLADAEATKYKRKLYVFKLRVAAAVALLVLATGSWLVWQSANGSMAGIAQQSAAGQNTANPSVASTNHPNRQTPETVAAQTTTGSSTTVSKREDSATDATTAIENQNSIPAKVKTPPMVGSPETPAMTKTDTKPRRKQKQANTFGQSYLSPESIAHTESNAVVRDGNTEQPNPNSIATTTKTPTVAPAKGSLKGVDNEEFSNILITNTVANSQAMDSRQLFQPLTGKSIPVQMATMPVKDIRWQLNQAFWDQVAIADVEEQQKKAAKQSRWQIGASFTPGSFNPNFSSGSYPTTQGFATTSGMDRTTLNSANTVSPSRTDLGSLTRPGISYNTGVQAEFAVSKRFSIQSGIQYTYNRSQIEASQYIASVDNNAIQPVFYELFNYETIARPTAGTFALADNKNVYETAVNTADVKALDNTYQYMGFPMRLIYRILNKKVKASVGTGVSADLFLRNRISSDVATIEAIEINRSQNSIYKNVSMSGLFSVKIDYSIGGKYSIYLEPTYRQAITSFTTSSTLGSYPSWWGIGTGVQYRF